MPEPHCVFISTIVYEEISDSPHQKTTVFQIHSLTLQKKNCESLFPRKYGKNSILSLSNYVQVKMEHFHALSGHKHYWPIRSAFQRLKLAHTLSRLIIHIYYKMFLENQKLLQIIKQSVKLFLRTSLCLSIVHMDGSHVKHSHHHCHGQYHHTYWQKDNQQVHHHIH